MFNDELVAAYLHSIEMKHIELLITMLNNVALPADARQYLGEIIEQECLEYLDSYGGELKKHV